MGNRVPNPKNYEIGDFCADCAHHWPYPNTPRYLWAKFNGMVSCPPPGSTDAPAPPNNVWFRLEQVHPCAWEYYDYETYAVIFYANVDDSGYIQLGHPAHDKTYFRNDRVFTKCSLFYYNELVCGGTGIASTDGYCVVSDGVVDDTNALLLTETYGFHPGKKNLFDTSMQDYGLHSVKLANVLDRSNCLCLYDDPDQQDPSLHLHGLLTPDATGAYYYDGDFNGFPSYVRPGSPPWYVSRFTHPVGGWAVSLVKSISPPTYGWYRTHPDIEGYYVPFGGTSGIGQIVLFFRSLVCNGILDPDATGSFHRNGMLNDHARYDRIDGQFHIIWWPSPLEHWILCDEDIGSIHYAWYGDPERRTGIYQPRFGGCHGTPTIREYPV